MKPKASDISTVIIVNKSKELSRTLQVKTRHISRLKHYAAGVLSVIVLLSGSIIYLRSKNQQQEQEKNQLMAQLVKLKATIPVPVIQVKKVNDAQSYIQSIEGKLQKINNYLRKRGLKGFATKAVGGNGGDAEAAKLTDSEKYSLYDEYLDRLVHTVAFTPMGYPRISSLTSYFGYRSDPFNSAHAEFHPGIDFKGNRGDEAKCTANGKVVFAGWYGGYGNCVRIAHANNFETLYGHLSRITVKVGQEVLLGQKIGEIGSTGHSTGNHLHYEIRKNGKAVNPISYLTLNN
jgi:murein DD-endopeptidase MepM/ murein hydrolase activator NlpD